MSALREILAHFGVEVDTKALVSGDHAVDGLIGKLKGLAHATAGVFAFHQIESFVEATVSEARELARASIMAGMTADELQRLRHAADMSGVETGVLSTALRFLQRNLFNAQGGSKGAKAAFEALGISTEKGVKLETVDILTKVSDAMLGLEDANERTGLAMKILGRGGMQLMPMLMKGGEAIRKYAKEVDELGGGFSAEGLAKSKEFASHHKQLLFVWRSMRDRLMIELVPALLVWGKSIEKIGLGVLKLNENGSLMRGVYLAAFVAIAARLPTIIGLFRSLWSSVLLPILPLAALLLLVDDLFILFTGGDSLIGRFFDHFDSGFSKMVGDFGVGTLTMFSSWENFVNGLLTALFVIPMAVGVLVTEIAGAFLKAFADIADGWDWLMRKLPGNAKDFLGIDREAGKNKTGHDNRQSAQETLDKARAGLGGVFAETLDSVGPMKKFRDAMAQRKEAAAAGVPYATFAGAGEEQKAGKVEVGQIVSTGAGTAAKGGTYIEDKKSIKIDVHVPGTTPATIAHQTGKAVGDAMRKTYDASLYSSEHVVEEE
jgi:hypothetical protein